MGTAMIVAAAADKDLGKSVMEAMAGGIDVSVAPEPPDLCNMDMRAGAVAAIKSSDALILILTESALSSPFVRFAAETARRSGVRLAPVLFQPIEAGALLTLTGGAEPVTLDPPPEDAVADGARALGVFGPRHAEALATLLAPRMLSAQPKKTETSSLDALEDDLSEEEELGEAAAPESEPSLADLSAPAPARMPPAPMGAANAADAGHAPAPRRREAREQARDAGAGRFRAAKLFENAPRRMRVGKAQEITVRISRDASAGQGMSGTVSTHEILSAGAMTVTLDDPSFGYAIRPLTPATQWVDREALASIGLGLEHQAAEWRWSVEPLKTGRRPLVIRASARVTDAQGVSAEAGLPEQIVEIRVGVDPARAAKDVARWVLFAIGAGVLGHYSVEIIETVNAFAG